MVAAMFVTVLVGYRPAPAGRGVSSVAMRTRDLDSETSASVEP